MAWAGMRGLVTLALVLAIPASATSYHHELSVIALTVLTCTMVVPGLLLPWLVDKLDLQNGPGADQALEELNQRAYDAARRAVREHGEEYQPEAYAMVQEWLICLRRNVCRIRKGPRSARKPSSAPMLGRCRCRRSHFAPLAASCSALGASAATTRPMSTRCSPTWTASFSRATVRPSPARAACGSRNKGLLPIDEPPSPPRFQNAKQIAFKTPSETVSKCKMGRSVAVVYGEGIRQILFPNGVTRTLGLMS